MSISRMAPIAAAIMLAAVATAAEGAGWKTYYNDRFGPSAEYPSDWKMGEEPANNDGRAFFSPDGAATITISGIRALDPRAKEMADAARPLPGQTITFTKRGDRWIVVSGAKGDRIFYIKRLLSCGDSVWNDVFIEYPAVDKAKYDALVAHVANSLKSGPGYDIGPCR